MKNTNNNRLIYTGVLLAATLSFEQAVQAAPLILGGDQTISTDTSVDTVVVGNSGAGSTGGNGTLTVNNGAALTNSGTGLILGQIGGVNYQSGLGYLGFNAGSTGVATITGANSLWQNQSSALYIGHRGQGTLNIEDGGKVFSASSYLGNNAGSTGTAIVTGTDSLWQLGALYVGNSGQGTLIVQNGGKVSSAGHAIGTNVGSTGNVTVTGADSLWQSSGGLSVNRGTLNIEDGGKVTNANSGSIGSSNVADTAATVTVIGQNSLWQNSTTLHVGNRSQGTLNVQDGGKVTNTNGYIGASNNHIGTVTVTGVNSLWQNSGFLNIGATNGGQGTLSIDDGGVVSATNGVTIWSTGSLSGNGGTLDGDVVNRGLIDPTEVFTITGDLALTETSILALDIFGPTVYDQLFIGGDFFIDGLLTLDFDGFTQSAFDTTYDLIHIGGDITGTWGDFDINVAGFDPALLGYSIVGSSVDGYSRALRLTIAGTGDTGGNPDDNTVPEPASILLIGLGGLAMLMLRRRSPRISLV